MSSVVKICLILFGLAYLISPFDIVPDLLVPYLGWLDDGAVLWTVYHLIRYGKLPWSRKSPSGSGASSGFHGENTNGKDKDSRYSDEPKTSGPGRKTSICVSDAYEILEVSSRASWKEIQAAYRDKSKKYHPDKVSHLGREFAQLANEKFIDIQNAYELLRKEKGK